MKRNISGTILYTFISLSLLICSALISYNIFSEQPIVDRVKIMVALVTHIVPGICIFMALFTPGSDWVWELLKFGIPLSAISLFWDPIYVIGYSVLVSTIWVPLIFDGAESLDVLRPFLATPLENDNVVLKERSMDENLLS